MLFTWNDKLNEGTIENIVFKDKPNLNFEYIWFHCDWISFQIIEKNLKENSESPKNSYLDKFNNSFKNKPKICSNEQKEEILEVYKEYYKKYIQKSENISKKSKKSSKNTKKSKEINYLGV